MNTLTTYRGLTVGAPLLGLFVGALVCWGQNRRLHGLEEAYQFHSQEVRRIQLELEGVTLKDLGGRVSAVEDSKTEQIEFLNLLRRYAHESGVEIVRWQNVVLEKRGLADKEMKEEAELPANISAIRSAIDARGSYLQIRRFLYLLHLSPRTLTMQKAQWNRTSKYPNTQVNLLLSRYIRKSSVSPITTASTATGATHGEAR